MIHERLSTDVVLLLACDGLWDVLSSEEAVDTIRELYRSGEKSMLKIAEEMVDIALDKGLFTFIFFEQHWRSFNCSLIGSKDNISAVVAKLPGAVIGDEINGGVDARRKARQLAQQAQEAKEAQEAQR